MGRLGIIDGLRGYFLVFMFLNHLYLAGGLAIVRVNHAELGFVQDAQGFVFLSGFLVGLVYGRKLMKRGFATAAKALWWRALELYGYTITCVTVILILRALLPDADRIWDDWLGAIGDGGVADRIAGAALLVQPIYFDILPQYILYFLVAPPILWLCVTGRWIAVVAGSLGVWLGVQLGFHLPAVAAINGALAEISPGLAMRAYFNVLAWQVLFFGGMAIGSLWAAERLDLDRFFTAARPGVAQACLALLLAFMLIRFAFTFGVMPDLVTERFAALENRPEFGLVCLVNFAALAYGVTWLLIAGPSSASRLAETVARGLRGLFGLAVLRLLGRHSLQVYAWHVIVVYVILWIDGSFGPFDQLEKTVIAFVGIVVLYMPAVLSEWRAARGSREGEPAAPASGNVASR